MFFEYPRLLFLLLLLIPLAAWYVYRQMKGKQDPSLQVSSLQPFEKEKVSYKRILYHVPFVLRMIALAALILAMSRPRSSSDYETTVTEGIDIMLAMDVSTSMLARDFEPDRIAAAKDIAIQFIAERPADRIGITVFAGESYTQCPPDNRPHHAHKHDEGNPDRSD